MDDNTTGTVNHPLFEWEIPRFRETLRQKSCIFSPDFRKRDSSWRLCAYLTPPDSCTSGYQEFLNIDLQRRDSGKPKTVTYTIKFHGLTNVNENTETYHFQFRDSRVLGLRIPQENWLPNLALIVTCYIRSQTPHRVTRSELVSCAVQTEALNETEVYEKENPKCVTLLSERMEDLLMKGTDHDVTICVQGKEFRAHRSILSIRSPVFAMMFSHDTQQSNTSTVDIEDCNPESFEAFLTHVYTGRTESVTPNNVFQLYYTADKYDFPGLKEVCVSLLKTSLSVDSICSVVLLAAKHQEKELLDVATEFFARNVKKILQTVGWQNFMTQNPELANELYNKSMEGTT